MSTDLATPLEQTGDIVAGSGGALALHAGQTHWTEEQEAALVQLGLAEAPDADRLVFLHVAQRVGLDPFARQIYMIGRDDQGGKKWTIQTGIDGFRVIAERNPQYAGQTPVQWCGEDGQWTDVWLSKKSPSAARVGIIRHDRAEPVYATCLFDEFAQTKRDGQLNSMWKTKGAHMIGKCLPADAPIETDRGRLRIGDVVDGRLPVRVRSVDLETGREVWARVVNWWRNPDTDQWVTIHAPTGSPATRGVRLTTDHPVWTPHGWRKAGELAVGDQVAVTSPTLSAEQHQVLLGGLLGDGTLSGRKRPTSNPHYAEAHAAGQGDYVHWKAAALATLSPTVSETQKTDGAGGTHDVVQFRTRAYPALQRYRPMTPTERLDELTDLGVAVWLMDDGNISPTGHGSRTPFIRVYCCGFGADFADAAAVYFRDRYGIEDVTVARRDHNPYLRIGVAGTAEVLARIEPWLVYDRSAGTKRWVAGDVEQGDPAATVFVPITQIDTRSGGTPEGRYDIEVEGTHTFVCRNLVISNCAEAGALRKAFPQDMAGLVTDDEAAGFARAAARTTVQSTRADSGPVDVGELTGQPTAPAKPAGRGRPSTEPRKAELAGGTDRMTSAHQKRLFEAIRKAEGLVERGGSKEWAGEVLGKTVRSWAPLTCDDANLLITKLEAGDLSTGHEAEVVEQPATAAPAAGEDDDVAEAYAQIEADRDAAEQGQLGEDSGAEQ